MKKEAMLENIIVNVQKKIRTDLCADQGESLR